MVIGLETKKVPEEAKKHPKISIEVSKEAENYLGYSSKYKEKVSKFVSLAAEAFSKKYGKIKQLRNREIKVLISSPELTFESKSGRTTEIGASYNQLDDYILIPANIIYYSDFIMRSCHELVHYAFWKRKKRKENHGWLTGGIEEASFEKLTKKQKQKLSVCGWFYERVTQLLTLDLVASCMEDEKLIGEIDELSRPYLTETGIAILFKDLVGEKSLVNAYKLENLHGVITKVSRELGIKREEVYKLLNSEPDKSLKEFIKLIGKEKVKDIFEKNWYIKNRLNEKLDR